MENMNELKDKLFAAIDTICKDFEANRPEFKVPGWYWHVERQIIFYAISKSEFYLQSNDGEYAKQNCIHPKFAEIESYLRKICDEKYIGKRTKCLIGMEVIKASYFENYDYKNDRMWYHTDYSSNICVYKQGKFAEIIPDKKKLPKTKKEFKELFNEFLNKYED